MLSGINTGYVKEDFMSTPTALQRWLAFVTAAWSVSPSAAPAQGRDEVPEMCAGTRLPFESPPFERFDRNDDERLTSGEAASCEGLAEIFSRLDLDADGSLSRAEYRSFADTWRRRVRALGDAAR
jgi:hypothetical protein